MIWNWRIYDLIRSRLFYLKPVFKVCSLDIESSRWISRVSRIFNILRSDQIYNYFFNRISYCTIVLTLTNFLPDTCLYNISPGLVSTVHQAFLYNGWSYFLLHLVTNSSGGGSTVDRKTYLIRLIFRDWVGRGKWVKLEFKRLFYYL